jgi:hypothetical protein
MKRTISAFIGVVLIATVGIVAKWEVIKDNFGSVEYRVQTEVVTEEVDALDARIQKAIEGGAEDTENKAREAYEAAKTQAELEIKLKVTGEYRAEVEKMEEDLKKQTTSY